MASSSTPGPVVVGVDGSGTDTAARSWAARTAKLRGVPLVLVHSTEIVAQGAGDGYSFEAGSVLMETLQERGEAPGLAAEAAQELAQTHPALRVEVEHTLGPASTALMAYQDRASMLVVGSGRKGRMGQLLLGTTSLTTAMHASCPVAVVSFDVEIADPPRGRVLLAVDGSRGSAAAAEVAFAEAQLRSAQVVAVSTWYLEVVGGYVVTEPQSAEWAAIEARQHDLVERTIAGPRAAHPEVALDIQVLHGPSVGMLTQQSGEADLLVMGTRGRGGFAGKLLGSVSQKVLRAAQCPVIVVPAEKT